MRCQLVSKTRLMIQQKFLPEGSFGQRQVLFFRCLVLKTKSSGVFLAASARLIPLIFFFSSFIHFSSAASCCFIEFLFLVSLLAQSVSSSLPVVCSKIGICVSGTSGLLIFMSRISFAYIAHWNWSLHWVQECGSSKVRFVQKWEIPRTFDTFDCAIIKISINLCRYVQLMYNYLKE